MNGESISSGLALSYRRAGLSVLPAVKAKKRPAVGAWRTWAGRLPTEIEVEAWFSNAYDAVCIVAGKVSNNLECIDFDQKAEAYPAWCAKIAPDVLDSVVVESTPSGGKHVVYRCETPVEGNLKLAQGMRDGKRKTLVETRGEGGLFLCSPTPGYALERGDFEHIPVISQEARESLLSAANFVQTLESRQGITISAPEEIAFVNGWIDREGLLASAASYGKSPYGAHLKAVAEGKVRY